MATRRVGFFRELKHGDPDGPALAEAVRSEPGADERELVAYLRGGTVLVGAPGLADDALDPSRTQVSPFHICTDGSWMWPLDLAYYVENYHVALPPEFVDWARSQGWQPPQPDRSDLLRLEEELLA